MNGLLIPLLTFFSRPFYASVSRDSSNKGFLYLLYLSGIFSIAIGFVMIFFLQPQANNVIEWVKKDMPVITLSKEGLSMNQPSPYSMTYPDFGPVVTFDMDKTTVTPEQMGKVPVFVTRTHFYVQENAQTRIYSVKDAASNNPNLEKNPVTINDEVVDRFYKAAKPTFFGIGLAGAFVISFLWKLLAALLYSLSAMGFNSMRVQKLPYTKLLDLTIYALTPATLFQILRMLVPVFNKIPLIFVLDISMTLAYVYFAVKMSEDESLRSSSSGFSR